MYQVCHDNTEKSMCLFLQIQKCDFVPCNSYTCVVGRSSVCDFSAFHEFVGKGITCTVPYS